MPTFLMSSLAAAVLFYLAEKPSRVDVAVTLVGGALLAGWLGLGPGPGYAKATALVACWAGSVFIARFVGPFVGVCSPAESMRLLPRMVIAPALVYAAAVCLALQGAFLRDVPTWDAHLYLADESVAHAAAFRLAVIFSSWPWLESWAEAVYLNLPFAAVAAYLLIAADSAARARRFVTSFLVLTGVGYACYLLTPGAGTLSWPDAVFPSQPPSVVTNWPLVPGTFPRNCLPSLHLSWALLILWRIPGRWAHAAWWLFVVPTLVGTISFGGHYVVDLVASLPFVAAIELAMQRRRSCVAAAGLFAGWIAVIRYGAPVLAVSPLVPLGIATISSLACWRLLAHRPDAESVPGAAPELA